MNKLLLTAAVLGAFAIGGPADAGHPSPQGMQCGRYADLVSQIEGRYGEAALPITFISQRGVYQFYANMETESWTVLRVTGQVACIVAAGDGLGEIIPVGDPT